MHQSARLEPDTEVIVIGNGPAGLSVSAFLSGIVPFYDTENPHPDRAIHKRLAKHEFEAITDQDLSWIEGTAENNGLIRPISAFYDSLARPRADTGANLPSSLKWHNDPSRLIPHLVLGETNIGGSWNSFDSEMLAVSFGGWLDLPGFTVNDYLEESSVSATRLPAGVVASYMNEYAKRVGISGNIQTGTTVTRITKQDGLWMVEGVHCEGQSFSVTARRVVLATGKMISRMLEVPGESECSCVVYDMPSMKSFVSSPSFSSSPDRRVVVVGDGISSADAVRFCLQHNLPVTHVIRKNDRELRGALMSRLSPTVYPEYNQVFRLMTGKSKHPLYERRASSSVEYIDGDSIAISTPNGTMQECFCVLVVCVGKCSTWQALFDVPFDISFGVDYRCEEDPSLFCVGSLAGDHFVRFLVGGCMQVAQSIAHDIRRMSTESLDESVQSYASFDDSDTLPLPVC